MANTKSSKKRILISERNRLQNQFYKSSVKTLTKRFLNHLKKYNDSRNPENKQKAQILLKLLYSLIDKGYKKNVFHKNTAARKKSKLLLHFKLI